MKLIVEEIRVHVLSGMRHKQIAELYSVSVGYLGQFCSRYNISRRKKPALLFDLEQLRKLIEVDLLTQAEVAKIMKCTVSAIERRCAKYAIKTQRTGPRGGDQHPDWKGGRFLGKGYWYVHSPDHPNCTSGNYMLEHRLIMEEVLGRYLTREEVVHHKDGNPQNNHPDNLELFACNADHLRHELTGRVPNWTPEGKARILEGCRRGGSRQK